VKEILREKEDQARSLSAKHPQQDSDATNVDLDIPLAIPLSPSLLLSSSLSSPSLQRRRDADSATPPLTADEDEADKLSHSSHFDQLEPPPGQGEGVSSESDGPPSPCGAGEATPPPLCSLSVFRPPDMLAFEDYLHRSRRLPTRLGFPDLLPSPDKWHDWSWGQLRAPVYVVPRRPEEIEAAAGADPPLSHGDVGDGILQPEVYSLTGPLGNTP
jgi:hypothetical protein